MNLLSQNKDKHIKINRKKKSKKPVKEKALGESADFANASPIVSQEKEVLENEEVKSIEEGGEEEEIKMVEEPH